ncbi:hypothetical protein [Mesobacillus maritimus]|uniref:Uncharacterized protein n=1 Tax=Mesobacillus maritimus TaxID=1643336 RepID=A0ABS7K1U2_9BACI|nr:hypothetical protein [Mesobacillus maritimus]MBY0096213.1 hypothetical protein [Mesobacillus maritimus]
MKKIEVIETKEMLRCEIIENYYVVYEKTETREYRIDHSSLVDVGSSIENTVSIFKGGSQSTLQKVQTYTVNCVDQSEIRDVILQEYPNLFKTAKLARQAV